MSAEFSPEYSPETVESAKGKLEQRIESAGSLRQYLDNFEKEQSKTPDGRAELLRINRVSYALVSPGSTHKTAEAEAFYDGGVLGSSLLLEMNESRNFTGGTLMNDFLNNHANKESERKIRFSNSSKTDSLNRDLASSRQIIAQLAVWPLEKAPKELANLYDFTHDQLSQIHEDTWTEDNNYIYAQAGFWAPIYEFYNSSDSSRTDDILNEVNSSTAHVEHKETKEQFLAREIRETLQQPAVHSLNSQRNFILRFFKNSNRGMGSNYSNDLDEFTKLSICSQQETELNKLNKHNEIFTEDDIIQVSGTYFYEVKNGQDEAIEDRMPRHIKLIGRFQRLTVIEVPTEEEFKRANHPAVRFNQNYSAKKRLSPAIVIENPTFMTPEPRNDRYGADENAGEIETRKMRSMPTEDTIVKIPLIYGSMKLERIDI